jgi:apolipoprotein D and lipocalin family protein
MRFAPSIALLGDMESPHYTDTNAFFGSIRWHIFCEKLSSLSRQIMKNLLHSIALAAFGSCFLSCTQPHKNQPTISQLDVARYSGKWHEIARLPNPFERNLVAATATYQAMPGGAIHVVNEGLKENGTRTSITGTARQAAPDDPGKLLVRFDKFPANLIEGDYWILETNPTYTRALVGSPDQKYLWLLSKNPADGPKEFSVLVQQAQQLGYATHQLYYNPQRITH